jgi:16S rRNA pseudouridine516 synthase
MRLDKFIAQQLGVSRAIAGREIRASRVTVDGDIVKDASFKLQPEHEVEYDGNPLTQQNGPRYLCSTSRRGTSAPRTIRSSDGPLFPRRAGGA